MDLPRVIIVSSLCIAESLQHRARTQNSLFHPATVRPLVAQGGQVM